MVVDPTHDAWEILAAAVEYARLEFGEQLAAAYALGSLAHGGFAPLVSDIDLALVLRVVAPDTGVRVAHATERVRRARPGTPADRLSVFWSDWAGVRHGAGPGSRLAAVDRLDLLQSGRLLYGDDHREPADRPGPSELVTHAAEFAAEKFGPAYLAALDDISGPITGGVRAVTKAVLFPVRFLYTLGTGEIGGNDNAVTWYAGPGCDLVRAAGRWRHDDLDATTAPLLRRHLTDLYSEFFDTYARATTDLGRPDLGESLRLLHSLIHPLPGP